MAAVVVETVPPATSGRLSGNARRFWRWVKRNTIAIWERGSHATSTAATAVVSTAKTVRDWAWARINWVWTHALGVAAATPHALRVAFRVTVSFLWNSVILGALLWFSAAAAALFGLVKLNQWVQKRRMARQRTKGVWGQVTDEPTSITIERSEMSDERIELFRKLLDDTSGQFAKIAEEVTKQSTEAIDNLKVIVSEETKRLNEARAERAENEEIQSKAAMDSMSEVDDAAIAAFLGQEELTNDALKAYAVDTRIGIYQRLVEMARAKKMLIKVDLFKGRMAMATAYERDNQFITKPKTQIMSLLRKQLQSQKAWNQQVQAGLDLEYDLIHGSAQTKTSTKRSSAAKKTAAKKATSRPAKKAS